MGYRLMMIAIAAICLALFVDGLIVLMMPDPPLVSHHKPIILHKEPEPLIIPPFPQLSEIPDAAVIDSSIPDSGAPFEKLSATLTGVVWSSNKWESTISLQTERPQIESDPDLPAGVYSLCDCIDSRPCNIIKTNYKLVTIDVRHAVIVHLPSGVTQELWVDGYEPPDAGKPESKIIVKNIWHKPYSWDSFY